MNFFIDKDVFLNNLSISQKALSGKSSNPAISGIYLDVLEDEIIMITSSPDFSIKLSIKDDSLKIDNTGSCLIPGRFFIDVIRKLDATLLNIMLISDNMLRIIAGRTDVTLNLLDLLDYPKIDFHFNENPIAFDAKMLKTIIKQTTFSCSSVENRPILTGVNLKIIDNTLFATATDSFRLSQKKVFLDTEYENFNVIIPAKSLDELAKIIENENSQVELHLDKTKVLFKFSNVLFQSRLLEGIYPETSRLIPSEYPIILTFKKDELTLAIDRASSISSKDGTNNIVKFLLKPDNVVEISSNSPEIGKIVEEVYPTSKAINNALKTAFSSKYFLEALKTFNTEEITVKFTGEIRPFVFESENEPELVELILPVRTE